MNTFITLFTSMLTIVGYLGIYVLAMGFPPMLLWNWLMPLLFGLPIITFFQAVGLSVLCQLLFKPFPIPLKFNTTTPPTK